VRARQSRWESQPVRSRPIRFGASPCQLAALDAGEGATAVALARPPYAALGVGFRAVPRSAFAVEA